MDGFKVYRNCPVYGKSSPRSCWSKHCCLSYKIEEIRSRGKLPILVGGTHYYTQSLLFRNALSDETTLEPGHDQNSFPILDEPTDVILAKLKEVDPVMAQRWHPNDRRKIRRSLEIFLKTGKPASKVYDEQRVRKELPPDIACSTGEDGSSHMRFPTLVFWVHANKETLYPRLDGRVDKMLARGLLREVDALTTFRRNFEGRTGATVDQSRGVWVSIGYKQFLDYHHGANATDVNAADLAKLKIAATEKTQAATRQYANSQIKWIRIKLLNAIAGAGQTRNVFLLNGSDLSKWEEDVLDPAISVAKRFLDGEELPGPSSLSAVAAEMLTPKREYDLSQRPDLWQKRTCETCGTVSVTENDWNRHVKSRGHRSAVGIVKKQKNTRDATEKERLTLQTDIVDVLEDYMHSFPDDNV